MNPKTHCEAHLVGDLGIRLFETKQAAREFVCRTNAHLDDINPTDADIVEWFVARGEDCIACGEFGLGGQIMGCAFERLRVIEDPGRRGWRVARERCMLRSWADARASGVDPLSSQLGCVNEL